MPENIENPSQTNIDQVERPKSSRSQYEPPSMTPLERSVDPKVAMPASGEVNTFDSTKELSEQGTKILRERAKAGSLNEELLPNLHTGSEI